MFTFSFFIKVFFSGLICTAILSTIVQECSSGDYSIIKEIGWWVSGILLLIVFGCTVISIFGMIWTF